MKKRLFMFATAALMLAACSNDGEVAVNDGAAQLQSGSGAVGFDIYTSSATKAGDAGVQTTATLQLTDKGFGVFSTYSNGAEYNPTTAKPNFMYNQQVKYSTGAWTYSPVKYWPNETLNDSQTPAATGGATYADNLSFFAYAPYVTSASGATGITAMTGNDDAGNPKISYAVATDPTQSVDLLWGVAPAGGLRYTAVNGALINIPQGTPLINLIKPDKDQKIKFLFQHALARVGMTVVAAVDQIAPGGNLDGDTKIFVNSVTLTDADDATPFTIPSSGKLNLKNAKAGVALWEETVKTSRFSATIDGANLNADLTSTGTGVTTSEKKVIAKDASSKDQYLMLIPTPGIAADFNVTIDYDVETTDGNLNGGKSTVNNVITKKITLNAVNTFDPTVTGFVNNRAYNLKLILGMTSVKLEAEVADWQVDGSTDVYLPQNTAE